MTRCFPLISMAVIFVAIHAADQCHNHADCAADECCEKPKLFPAITKRYALAYGNYMRNRSCKKYSQSGQTCGPLAKFNGHCGCAKDLECRQEHLYKQTPYRGLKNLGLLGKRSMLNGGMYTCQPKGQSPSHYFTGYLG